MTAAPPPRFRIAITTSDGRRLLWRRHGQVHSLAGELAPTWVANFKPALFQVTPEGALVPRGSNASAMDIAAVAMEVLEAPEAPDAAPG